jgi:PII-like signaling protein
MTENNPTTWTGLTSMARVDVVVDGEHVPLVRDLLLEAGATGYTALHGVSGFGHHGEREGRLLFNDRNSLALLISVIPFDRVDPVVAGIRRLLDEQHGVVFVSETHVSRPDYFRATGDTSS